MESSSPRGATIAAITWPVGVSSSHGRALWLVAPSGSGDVSPGSVALCIRNRRLTVFAGSVDLGISFRCG
jgi:hypothetical protein